MQNLLFLSGADVNLQDNQGTSALHYAMRRRKPKLAELLIKYGADVTLQDIESQTAEEMHYYVFGDLYDYGSDLDSDS